MGYNIGPKIGIDGEAEFRRQIRDINAEYKALEAETKALTAAFEANGDEQGKLEGTTKVLEKQIASQKSKIELLEDALQKATTKYGENSVEASRLRGALYDTQATLIGLEGELQDTNRRLEEAANGMEEFQEETEDAGDAALDFSDILGANFIADAAKDALDEVIDAVVEFAKEMPEAASEVNAANSQFEQTFKELEGTARSALQSISDETGIAASRIQENYTQLYAFTKSVGGDSAEALDIASRAMIAAADNAAYYDKSIEEATEQLQSFIKGNYENDSALGISATETARNTKANELYAKSFNELSESQKVDVLLAMVEAGNEASGAMGQAAREADSWTNVQGELDEAMRQFQATLGAPVLKTVTPIIQDITDAIYDLIEQADWQVLQSGIDDFADAMETAEKQCRDTTKETESAAYTAEYYVKRLKELEEAGLDTADAQSEYAAIVEELNSLIPDLNVMIDEQTGLIEQSTSMLLSDIQAWEERAAAQALQDKLTEQLKAQGRVEADLYEAKAKKIKLEAEEAALKRQLTELTGEESRETDLFTQALQENSEAFLNSADSAAGLAVASAEFTREAISSRDEVAQLKKQLEENQIQQAALTNTIQTGEETLVSYQSELENTKGALNLFSTETAAGAEEQDALNAKIQELQQTLTALEAEYAEAKEAARDSIDAQIGLFDELSAEAKMTTEEIVANWLNQQEAFNNYAANLKKAVDMGLDQALIKQLADGSEESMLILNEFVNGTEKSIKEINTAFLGLNRAKDTASAAMAEARTGANAEMDKLIADARTWGADIVDGAIAGVNANASRFNSSMKSLATGGSRAFKDAMVIQSPSRLMIDASEDVVAGAVIGVERNIEDYEAAMASLGSSGYWAYLDERADLAEDFPNLMDSIVVPGTNNEAPVINYGGFEIHIYQQTGEDAEDLAHRLMDTLQIELEKKEVSFSAYN